MGYDRNDPWMTCGERDDAMKKHGLESGTIGDPFDEIARLKDRCGEMASVIRRHMNHKPIVQEPQTIMITSGRVRLLSFTDQEINDLLEALVAARGELCCGTQFPEANAIDARWTALEDKLEHSK